MNLNNLPKKKIVSSIITIQSVNGKKYNLILDTKKDRIGFSYHDKTLKVKFSTFNKISVFMDSIQDQVLERKMKGSKS